MELSNTSLKYFFTWTFLSSLRRRTGASTSVEISIPRKRIASFTTLAVAPIDPSPPRDKVLKKC